MENLSICDLPTEILASIALWLRQDTLDFGCFVLLTSRLLRTKIGSTPIINKFEYLKSHKSNKAILIDWKVIIKHFPYLQHFSTDYWPSSKSNSSFTHSCLFHVPRYRICTLHLEFDDSLQACFVHQKLPNSNHPGNWIPFNFEVYFPHLTDLRIIGNQLDNSTIASATWVDLICSLPRKLHSLGLGMVNLNQDALSNLPPSLTSLTWHGLPIGGATLNDAKLGSLKFLSWLPSNHKIIDFLISIPPCCTHVTLIDAPWTDECASVIPRTIEHLVLSTARPSHHRHGITSNCDFTPRAILLLPSTLKTLKIHVILKEFHRWTPDFFDNMVSHLTSLETFEWRFPSLGERHSDYCAVPSSLTRLNIDNSGRFGRLWNMNEWPVGLGFIDTGPNSLSPEGVSAMLMTPFANLHTLHVCADVFGTKSTYQLLPRTLIVLKLFRPNISDYSISLLPRGLKCLHILTDYDYGAQSNAQLSDLCFEDLPRGLTDLKIEAGRLRITGQPAACFLARKRSSSMHSSTLLAATRMNTTMNRETTFQPKSSFQVWDRTTCLENCLLFLPDACRNTFRLHWDQSQAYQAHNACVLLTLSNFPENFVTHIALPAQNLCPSVWLKCYDSITNVKLENETSDHLAILLKKTPLSSKNIPSAFSSLSSITAHVDAWLLEGLLADLPKTVTRLKILRPNWRYYGWRYEWPTKLLLPTQLKHLSIPTFTTHWAKENLVDTKLISFEVTQIQSISSKHLVFLPRTLNTFSASRLYDNVYNREEIPEPMIMDSWLLMLPKTVRNLTFSPGLALTDRAILKHQNRFDKIEVGVLIIKELPLAFGNSLLSQQTTSANYTRSSPTGSPKKASSAKPTISTPTSAKKVSTMKLSSSVTPGTKKTSLPANNSSLPTSMSAQSATTYGRNIVTPTSSTSRTGLKPTTASTRAPILASTAKSTAKPLSLVTRPTAPSKDNPYATISSIVVPSTIIEAHKAIPSFKTLVEAKTISVQWSHLAQIHLPQTLTDLRFTNNDIGTQDAVDDEFVARLPRGVLHLHILTQSGLTSKCISSLPPTLVTLKINACNIPESALMKLPRTLVELTILGGSHELKSSSMSWPPNLKLLHLLADPSHVSTCHIDDDYVRSLLHGLEDLSITHATLMSCNGLGLLPRSITKLHLNCPLIGDFDVTSLPTDVHNVSATIGTSFEWFLAMKRL